MSPIPSDVDLQLKKRARRRLLGAVAFAGLAAVVLPMVMDDEPKQQIPEVQIRIPGQDQTPFNPKIARATPPDESTLAPEGTRDKGAAEKPVEKVAEKPVEKKTEKPTLYCKLLVIPLFLRYSFLTSPKGCISARKKLPIFSGIFISCLNFSAKSFAGKDDLVRKKIS